VGWNSEINQLVIGEALSDEFDGKILNPYGVEIDLPFWVFKRLKKLHLLDRDPGTGMRRIQERVFGLMDLWDGPDFRPDRRFRAFDPGYQRACSKDSGYASAFLKALGRDCSGLVNPAIERTRNFESTLITHACPASAGALRWTKRCASSGQKEIPVSVADCEQVRKSEVRFPSDLVHNGRQYIRGCRHESPALTRAAGRIRSDRRIAELRQ